MRRLLPPLWNLLLLAEGLAIGALVHSGVLLMGTNLDAIQRAIVLGIAVVGACLDSAGDALICFAVHSLFLLCFGLRTYCAQLSKIHTHSCNLEVFMILLI